MPAYITSIPGIITLICLVLLIAVRYFMPGKGQSAQAVDPRTVMQIFLSIVTIAAAFYVILSGGYPDDVQKWAFGAVGTVLGYWLPS